MSHKHKRNKCFCDKPRYFHDVVGKGAGDSTPITVPKGFNTETGSSLDLAATSDNPHPGPFAAAAFHPSSQISSGLFPRRNTPNKSPEKAGKILMDDKKHGNARFYKPRIKSIHRNFAKKHH